MYPVRRASTSLGAAHILCGDSDPLLYCAQYSGLCIYAAMGFCSRRCDLRISRSFSFHDVRSEASGKGKCGGCPER